MKDFNRRRFLGRLAATVAVGLSVPKVATAAGSISIEYTRYKKSKKTGAVTKVLTATIGPYDQTEAQTVLRDYQTKTSEDKDFTYFYKARIK